MKNLKYACLTLLVSSFCVFVWLGILPSQAAQPAVQLHTEPALSSVVPDEAPVRITLQAVDATGKALSDVRFNLQLLTPAKTPWFTSDFPIVEGTTLLEMDVETANGTLEFEQVMPIRGQYALKAQVTPQVSGAFEPFEQSLMLSVPENLVKYKNAAILAGILLVAGFGSGWIVGGDQVAQADEIAPQNVRFLLSGATMVAIAALLIVNISAELPGHSHGEVYGHGEAHGQAHSHGETAVASPAPILPSPAPIQRSPNLEIRMPSEQQATVGQLASQTVQVINLKTQQPEAKLAVEVKTVALEDGKQMFAYRGTTDSKGQITWKEQFFDGAPHQVTATIASSNEAVLQASQDVEVEAIAPPIYIRLISLSYYTGVFVISLLTGIWLHKRSAHQATLGSH
jgi:hypothetical protein